VGSCRAAKIRQSRNSKKALDGRFKILRLAL
jgi:hypothetical protein